MKMYEDPTIVSIVGRFLCSTISFADMLTADLALADLPSRGVSRISIVEFNGPQFQTNLAILLLDRTRPKPGQPKKMDFS